MMALFACKSEVAALMEIAIVLFWMIMATVAVVILVPLVMIAGVLVLCLVLFPIGVVRGMISEIRSTVRNKNQGN